MAPILRPVRLLQSAGRTVILSTQKQQCLVDALRRRGLHDSTRKIATAATTQQPIPSPAPSLPSTTGERSPLSVLPLKVLLRSYAITSLSCSSALLAPSLRLLSALAHSNSPLLNPDRNHLLRYLLKKSFYAQFCAGENPSEVRKTITSLTKMGFHGVILGYAREGVVGEGTAAGKEVDEEGIVNVQVEAWKQGTLATVRLARKGDCVSVKFSGAGSQALRELSKPSNPGKFLEDAITEICELAKVKTVRLLFDAEQNALQAGIDAWTLDFQRRYNRDVPGQALVYGTYQAYMRSTPATLARHLAAAADEGFTCGIKLVRGAYLGSDPRHLFWSKKEDTDNAYNAIAEALMKQTYNSVLVPLHGNKRPLFPKVNLVLASHNLASVKKAMYIRQRQLELGQERIQMAYGQLMGMADHVSCELIQWSKLGQGLHQVDSGMRDIPHAYKYLVWGTVGECLKYLLRRAQENQDALARTQEGRLALRSELSRRVFST